MKIAKLFKNGQSQAVRLPKEFRFTGDRVQIKKQGDIIMLMPLKTAWWKPLVESLNLFPDDFMNDREQPKDQQEREFE